MKPSGIIRRGVLYLALKIVPDDIRQTTHLPKKETKCLSWYIVLHMICNNYYMSRCCKSVESEKK